MTPYEPSYIPQAGGLPSGVYQPTMADIPRLPGPGMQNRIAGIASAFNAPGGPAQQMQQQGAAPPPPQLGQAPPIHPGQPGGMDPAALQSMMQIYHTLQPSGQLGLQMQAAGIGAQPGQVPGLLSRFH